ncbi:GntR family transcriptional regulator [Oceanispirochaeta crateris]|uniref:GntR family transcriptional regulator n=1 Tax=Oceanispirochaeta crateris TaxID=2518645 RepID=A0A5C1QGX6_9SPIO|nr:GntR family transcriptional regulator [Oceanispirochaeta crateris]QEN06727.1 GntR family transcriptional regulator [Oceanispirochaeta crateris]
MAHFKYQIVYESILDEIRSGKIKPGEKLSDIDDLKEMHKTSSITINRALNELQINGYIERIKGTGSFVSHKNDKNEVHVETASQFSGQFISCIIPFDSNHNSFLQGVEQVSRQRNLMFTIHNSQFSAKLERDILCDVRRKGAAGIIIYPVSDTENLDLYTKMLQDDYPFVVIDRKLKSLEHSFVSSSNTKSFYDITEYLINKNHRKIGFIAGKMTLSSTSERFQGYCRALSDAGIEVDKRLVKENFFVQTSQPNGAEIQKLIKQLISSPLNITALACANDFIASMIIQQSTALGIKIPQDLSITGFDNLDFTPYLNPPLTTISHPFIDIGKEAADLLADMIQNQRIVIKTARFPALIIERESVSCLK